MKYYAMPRLLLNSRLPSPVRDEIEMWPFKPKVGLEEFCAEFYNSTVFRPAVSLKKDAPLMWDSALKLVQDVDYAIAQVEQADFLRELNSLRIELFGLAWTHALIGEQFLVRELLFTRKYLDDMQRKELWETMAEYNNAILTSVQDLEDRSGERDAVAARLLGRGLDEEGARRLVA